MRVTLAAILTTITTCQESQLKERMEGNVVIENIQKTITEVSCRSCEGGEVLQLLPFFDLQNAAKVFSDGRKF